MPCLEVLQDVLMHIDYILFSKFFYFLIKILLEFLPVHFGTEIHQLFFPSPLCFRSRFT